MRRNSGSDDRSAPAVPGLPGATPPPATRARPPGWRDPRLWVGVGIVAASVVVGARVLAAADDTVSVWAVRDDVAAGVRLTDDDLEARRLHFSDDGEVDRYLRVDDDLPGDLTLARAIGAGELVPRAALGSDDQVDLAEVPLEVSPGQVPPSVRPGALVDVYLLGDRRQAEVPALDDVTVVAVPVADDTFAPTGLQQVVVAVPADDVPGFYRRLGGLDEPGISVVRAHS